MKLHGNGSQLRLLSLCRKLRQPSQGGAAPVRVTNQVPIQRQRGASRSEWMPVIIPIGIVSAADFPGFRDLLARQRTTTVSSQIRQKGASLSEWMLVIILLGIVSAAGFPGFRDLLAQQRTTAVSNQILSAIRATRFAAIHYQTTATLCPTDDDRHCAQDWSMGAIAFLDNNASGQREEGESLLRVFPPLPKGSTLRWRSFGSKPYLQMTARGLTRHQNGNFLYCPPNADPRYASQIILHVTGRTRSARDADGDGIREDNHGQPLNCAP